MRRIALLAIALALFAGTRAEAQPDISLRGNVGAAFFQSPEGLNSVLNSGIDLGLGASVRLYGGLELILQGGYDEFTLNENQIAFFEEKLEVGSSSKVEGGDLNLLNATVGLRYVFRNEGSAQPYISSGIGIYRTRIARVRAFQDGQSVGQVPERSTSDVGVHFALGVDFRINDSYTFFFEPRYVLVSADEQELEVRTSTRYIPVRLGLEVTL